MPLGTRTRLLVHLLPQQLRLVRYAVSSVPPRYPLGVLLAVIDLFRSRVCSGNYSFTLVILVAVRVQALSIHVVRVITAFCLTRGPLGLLSGFALPCLSPSRVRPRGVSAVPSFGQVISQSAGSKNTEAGARANANREITQKTLCTFE